MGKYILSEIWVYPIKSLGGIRLAKAKVMEKGFQYDRRWMLIDENNRFMTQRVQNSMALFKQTIDSSTLTIQFRDDVLKMPLNTSVIEEPILSNVWDDSVTVFEVSKEYSDWFSHHLDFKCRLVSFPESYSRPVDVRYKINDEQVSLADAYPFLIIGQSSLDDLNSRLEVPVPMNRFRPNLVFTGGQPYEEDEWKSFTIGNNRFAGVKPCARCVLTTVNQDTAEKGKEPLLTLSKYRRQGEKVLFGQNVLAIDHNEIHEGDEISF
jgi:uncharacterized protein YcbX